MAFWVLAVVVSVLGILIIRDVVAALCVYSDDLVVVPFDALHTANFKFLHFLEVDVQIEHLIKPAFNTQSFVELQFAACVPSVDLILGQNQLLLSLLTRGDTLTALVHFALLRLVKAGKAACAS